METRGEDLKIFVVEEDYFFLEVIKEELKEEGFTNTSTFNTGKALLDSMGQKPDIIIINETVNSVRGIEIYRKVKMVNDSAKVIFLTDKIDVNKTFEALQLGASAYMEKGNGLLGRLTDRIHQLNGTQKRTKKKSSFMGRFLALL